MREIKVRFWNIDSWAYITIGQVLSDVQRGIYSGACINGEKFYLFTGLKDKNGKDIFEGDIIGDWTKTDEGLLESHCPVFWNEPTGSWHLDCSFQKDQSESTELWLELNDFEYEIKGNIYENPELLKTN